MEDSPRDRTFTQLYLVNAAFVIRYKTRSKINCCDRGSDGESGNCYDDNVGDRTLAESPVKH